MVSTFGFNGFLKSTSNLNLMYKPSDSGYYSFDSVVSTASNNYPITNTSGFLQCVVEGSGVLVAQYLYYSNNVQYYRVGEVSLSPTNVVLSVVWSTWNYLVNDSFFEDKPTREYYNINYIPMTRSIYTNSRTMHQPYSNSQFWTSSPDNRNLVIEGMDSAFEYKGDVDSTFDILNSTKKMNGWFYKKDTTQGNFPKGGTGILKVFTSANVGGVDVSLIGERQFIFISDLGEYSIGRAKSTETNITWDTLITKSDYWLTYNSNINTIENIMYTDTVRNIRLSSPSYQDYVESTSITLRWGGPWLLANAALTCRNDFNFTAAAWFRTPQIYRASGWNTVATV